jgi:predicted acylesterase/phospholipase RssA
MAARRNFGDTAMSEAVGTGEADVEREIAIALSGGGHRATIFALGVLLYLVDTGLNRRVSYISSVSGGSIANAFVAQRCDFREATVDEFDRIASALLQKIVSRGLYRGTFALPYMILLVLSFPLILSMYYVAWPVPISGLVAVLLIGLVAAIGFLRGTVVTLEMSRRFFSPRGKSARLDAQSRSVEHVFCSTDLRSKTPVYFSTWNGGYIHFSALGSTRLRAPFENVALGTIVRASAAFPGGIPPKRFWIGAANRYFSSNFLDFNWFVRNTSYRNINHYRPKFFFLADGGVWNNLGTQALLEDRVWRHFDGNGVNRQSRTERASEKFDVIVANASAPVKAQSLWHLFLPLIGDVGALFRSINILTMKTVVPMVSELRAMARCVVVDIADSMDEVADRVEATASKLHPEDGDLRRYLEAISTTDIDHGFRPDFPDGVDNFRPFETILI